MPTLGAALDFAKLEGRNLRAHQLGAAPSSPVTGQLYYNTGDNTLYWWDGTAWQSAKGGSGTPTGAAGGDLSGTYPNPQIAAGVIVNADISASAAIALAKLATDPLARANHTGTQLAATISDFITTRDLQRLDQHVAPTASVNLNNQKIINIADPTQPQDVANKRYADSIAQGLTTKQACRVASTANILIPGPITSFPIDGIGLANGDRVLFKNQTNQTENGIYVWTLGVGMARADDMDSAPEFPSAYTWINEGATQADTGWVCTNDISMSLDVTGVTWVQFASAGTQIAGAGLTKTGNTLDVGAATGITVAADTVGIDGTIIPRYYSSATHGAGTTIAITKVTHGCRASRGLVVQVQDEASGAVELPDVVVAATGDVTVTYGASVAANSKRVTVIG